MPLSKLSNALKIFLTKSNAFVNAGNILTKISSPTSLKLSLTLFNDFCN